METDKTTKSQSSREMLDRAFRERNTLACVVAICIAHAAHEAELVLVKCNGDEAAARARTAAAASANVDPLHEHGPLTQGPRMPLRWGSAPTEVCSCGAWRTNLHVPGPWRLDSLEAAVAAAQAAEDEDL